MRRFYACKSFILALLGLIVFSWKGQATDIYVHPGGIGPIPCYSTISAAIAAANAGDNINVQAGVYKENIIINKSIQLIGVGLDASSVVIKPSTSNIGTLAGAGSEVESSTNVIAVLANNVSIKNLTVDGSNDDISGNQALVGGVMVDARNGITNYVNYTENNNNLLLDGITVKNCYGRGVTLWTASLRGANAIRNCTFENIQGNGASIGAFSYWTSLVVDNCTFNAANTKVNQTVSFTYTNNQSTNSSLSVEVSNATSVTIENNLIDCRKPGSFGIRLSQTGGVLVKDNEVYNSAYGITIDGSYSGGAITLTGNTLDGSFGGYAGSMDIGVFATTEVSGFAPGYTISLDFSGGNSIHHSSYGMYLEASNATRNASGVIVSTDTDPSHSYTMNVSMNDLTFSNIANDYIALGKEGANSHIPNIIPTNTQFDAFNTSSLTDCFAIEDKIYHRMDDAALSSIHTEGLVNFANNKVFVTRGGTNTSAQRGFDVAQTGWSVYLNGGPAYAEDLNITESVSLGCNGSTSVRGLTMNGVGKTLTLLNEIGVDNNLTFTNGLIETGVNKLELRAAATVTGATDASHVNGIVTKQGGSAFVFPIGNGTIYRPLAIGASGTVTDVFEASYTAASAQALSSTISVAGSPTMIAVSGKEYWHLEQTNGSSTVAVGVNWRSEAISGTKTSDAHLTLAARSTGGWSNLGGTASTSGGLVWVTAPSNSGSTIYTLGSTNGATALPLYFIRFNIQKQNTNVRLEWEVGDNEAGTFSIERSENGISFNIIGTVLSGLNTNSNAVYMFTDNKVFATKAYYRIRWTNGLRTVYSDTRVITSTSMSFTPSVYYAKGKIKTELPFEWEGGKLTIVAANGNKVYEQVIEGNAETIPVTNWAAGLYIVQLQHPAYSSTISFKVMVY